VASWPGLCALLIGNNTTEINKKKAIDVNAFKLFKRLVATAQDQTRSGAWRRRHTCPHDGGRPQASDRYFSDLHLSRRITTGVCGAAGSNTLLLRRATKMFGHVREVLGVSGLSTPIGLEYLAVLRAHLLGTPAYCACAKPEDAQGAVGSAYMQLH